MLPRFGGGSSIVFGLLLLLFTGAEQSVHTSEGQQVANWIRARCGDFEKPALWAYQGALYDPLDGKRIAHVHGLEIVSQWCECNSSSADQKANYGQRCGDLIAGDLLAHPNATYDYASTFLSRKLFCYTQDHQNVLRAIRLRPRSPLKKIPTDQAVALYDMATTCITRASTSSSARSKEFIVLSEWPGRRSFWGMASWKYPNQDNPETFEFTVYTKRRSSKSSNALPDLQTPVSAFESNNNNDGTTVVSPKRSALVQFGSSNLEERHKFGARETYSYSISPHTQASSSSKRWWHNLALPLKLSFDKKQQLQKQPTCSVRYVRYGEGPPFYAPGRMCTLELTGRRIDTLAEATPLLASLVQRRIPGFWNLSTASSFREIRGTPSMNVLDDPEDPPPLWHETIRDRFLSVVHRVRAATTLQAPTSGTFDTSEP